jgi:hypothetical protein
MESPALDDAIGAYAGRLGRLLDAVSERESEIREALEEDLEYEDRALEDLIGGYLEASDRLRGLLVEGAAAETPATPFTLHAIRRLGAAAAGDLLAAQAVALLGATTPSAFSDLVQGVSEPPPLYGEPVLEVLRQGVDPFPSLLDDVRRTARPLVLRALSGGPVVLGGSGAVGVAGAMAEVRSAIAAVVGDGAATLERTAMAGVAAFGGAGVGAHVVNFFTGDIFRNAGHLRWLLRKVLALFEAARRKLLALFGTEGPDAVRRLLERVIGPAEERLERRLLRRVLNVDGLEEQCQDLLEAKSDSARAQAVARLAPISERARELYRWAGYGATGIRIARTLQVFAAAGALWPALLAMSVGLSGFTLWIVQDHLDWPEWGWVPEHFPGVRLSL